MPNRPQKKKKVSLACPKEYTTSQQLLLVIHFLLAKRSRFTIIQNNLHKHPILHFWKRRIFHALPQEPMKTTTAQWLVVWTQNQMRLVKNQALLFHFPLPNLKIFLKILLCTCQCCRSSLMRLLPFAQQTYHSSTLFSSSNCTKWNMRPCWCGYWVNKQLTMLRGDNFYFIICFFVVFFLPAIICFCLVLYFF